MEGAAQLSYNYLVRWKEDRASENVPRIFRIGFRILIFRIGFEIQDLAFGIWVFLGNYRIFTYTFRHNAFQNIYFQDLGFRFLGQDLGFGIWFLGFGIIFLFWYVFRRSDFKIENYFQRFIDSITGLVYFAPPISLPKLPHITTQNTVFVTNTLKI